MADELSLAVELGKLPELVGYQLRMTQLCVFKDFNRSLADLAIQPASYGALQVLYHNPGLTQTRLAAVIGLDRSSLVPLLDKLEQRKLLSREPCVEDRRSNLLHLTAAGEALLLKANRAVQLHEKRVLAALSQAEIKQLIQLLSKIGVNQTGAS